MEIKKYINKIVEAEPEITSIWLIGSRINGSARDDSDWDFIVFANENILSRISRNTALHRKDVDLLVVYDGENFRSPWGREKSGSLSKWGWNQKTNTSATYNGTKAELNSLFISISTCNALCVHGS